MKVLHYTTKFLPVSQTFISDLIAQLGYEGISNKVITHSILVNKKEFPYKIVDISQNNLLPLLRRIVNFAKKRLGLAPNLNHQKGKKELLDFSPDIIHCHFGTAGYFNFFLQKYALTHIPVVVSFHGYDVFNIDKFETNYRETISLIGSRPCLFTCPSDFLKQQVINTFNINPQKVLVVPNGFNEQLFTKKNARLMHDKTIQLVHIGRFIELKGQKYLIEALAILKKKGKCNIKLTLVGDGDTLIDCKRLVEELNLTEEVCFTGAIAPTKVASILEQSHLYVHPSFTLSNGQAETFGISILEAIASGKPVIITDSGGMQEILPNPNSAFVRIVQQKSADELATAIEYFIDMLPNLDPLAFEEFKEEVIQQNNLNKTTQLIKKCYRSLVEQKAK